MSNDKWKKCDFMIEEEREVDNIHHGKQKVKFNVPCLKPATKFFRHIVHKFAILRCEGHPPEKPTSFEEISEKEAKITKIMGR